MQGAANPQKFRAPHGAGRFRTIVRRLSRENLEKLTAEAGQQPSNTLVVGALGGSTDCPTIATLVSLEGLPASKCPAWDSQLAALPSAQECKPCLVTRPKWPAAETGIRCISAQSCSPVEQWSTDRQKGHHKRAWRALEAGNNRNPNLWQFLLQRQLAAALMLRSPQAHGANVSQVWQSGSLQVSSLSVPAACEGG